MISDLGERLLALIARKGYPSVASAARACGASRSQLSDIIHGRKSPSLATLARLLGGMGAGVEDLYPSPCSPQGPEKEGEDSCLDNE